jgi:thiamine biosynthesis lipoprotein
MLLLGASFVWLTRPERNESPEISASKLGPHEYFTQAMGTRFSLTLIGHDYGEGLMLARAAFAEVERIERRVSSWREHSEIGRLNRAEGDPSPLSAESWWMLERAQHLNALTHGAFDVTWAALKGAWNFRRAVVPPHAELLERLSHVGRSQLTLTPPPAPLDLTHPQLTLPPAPLWARDLPADHPVKGALSALSTEDKTSKTSAELYQARLASGASVDLGGIAKGYALDSAARLLRRFGARRFLLDGGGDLLAYGEGPSGVWRAGVRHPRREGLWCSLSIPDGWSVVTSGVYERFFMSEGQRMHHIIDLRTGYPAQASVSLTLVAREATLADALATGLFVLGPKEGLSVVERLEGVEALWMTPTGEVVVSEGFDRFAPSLPSRWRALSPP